MTAEPAREYPAVFDQLCAHGAEPITLPGEYGPLAALAAVPRGAAATVLMVPGYTGSKEDFAPLLDPVAAAGLAAVALDQPGQHESPGPVDEHAYLPEPLGRVLAAVVASLAPQPVILLGHSYGGLAARAAVLAGARVAGLVLLCTGPSALPDGPRRAALEAAEPVLRTRGVHAVQLLREAAEAQAGTAPASPELAEFLRRRFLASSAAGLLGMATALRTEPDRIAELSEVLRATATPCLVACGERDDAWPVDVQRDMARRLGAPFATVPHAAHSPNTENPAALVGLLLPTVESWLAAR